MNIGKMRNKVTILVKQKTNCFEDENFIPKDTVWGQIINVHGKEFIEAQKTKSNISKKVIIRYRKYLDANINPSTTIDHRIEYKGVQYNILYSDNIREENRFIELLLENI